MPKIKYLVFGLAVLGLGLFAASVGVSAHDGYDHSSEVASTVTEEGSDDRMASQERERNQEREVISAEKQRSNAEKLRARGNEILSEARKERHTERTKEQRQRVCEQRKQGLQTKVANIVKNGQKHQARIDEVLSKVIAYKQDKQLVIDDYDSLLQAATAAQTRSKASVEALSTLKPTVDCNSDSVAADVAVFKAAASQARSDLQSYKTAVKKLLVAAQAARQQEDQ